VHPSCKLQSRARTHAVLVIGLYELLGNATTSLSHPGPKVTKKRQQIYCQKVKEKILERK
jgi:hypothetical protein